MGLNLNKGSNDEKSPAPNSSNKGLNLGNPGDTSKSQLNLAKDKVVSAKTINNKETNKTETVKKKSPVLLLVIPIVLLGGGIFWFLNRDNTSQKTVEVESSIEDPKAATDESNNSQDEENFESNNATVGSNIMTDEVSSSINYELVSTIADLDTDIIDTAQSSLLASNQSSSTNKISNSSTSVSFFGSLENKAKQVISGEFGNGSDRKQALGAEYDAIQAKVNEMYRSGLIE
jgi:hypothetical protein